MTPTFDTSTLEPGQWISYRYPKDPSQYVAKVVRVGQAGVDVDVPRWRHIEDGTPVVIAQAWHVAQITRRTRAFGQKIDRTPYRDGSDEIIIEAERVERTLHPTLAARRDQDLERIMRLPTYAQRRYRREQARKARAK